MGLFNFKKEKRSCSCVNNYLDVLKEMFYRNTQGLKCLGYTRISDNPEIRAGVDKIAEIIANTTIHLMKNTETGDMRIKNGLSYVVDIAPNSYQTRQVFMSWIVKQLIYQGNAIVLPILTDSGEIKELRPVNDYEIIEGDEFSTYKIRLAGRIYKHDEVLHFKINAEEDKPYIGEGYTVTLYDAANNLKQAGRTVNEFLSNRVIPNIIISVDALTKELSSEEGRSQIFKKYIKATQSGEPWIIPAGLIDIKEVKPLTLNDIAIRDNINMSRETVASILGVPGFFVGMGEFKEDEYNNFIKTRVTSLIKAIEQELTKKILYSNEYYFKFNIRSIYQYDFTELTNIYTNLYTKGIVTGNEVRDALGLEPKKELEELIILENFIPVDKIGTQKKLNEEV